MLEAGSLKRPITIQKQSTTQDDCGQQVSTWIDVVSCFGSINAATSKEVYAVSGFVSQVSHKITIRYQDVSIHSNMRVVYRNRTFLIQTISDKDESRVALDLLCLEINQESN